MLLLLHPVNTTLDIDENLGLLFLNFVLKLFRSTIVILCVNNL